MHDAERREGIVAAEAAVRARYDDFVFQVHEGIRRSEKVRYVGHTLDNVAMLLRWAGHVESPSGETLHLQAAETMLSVSTFVLAELQAMIEKEGGPANARSLGNTN